MREKLNGIVLSVIKYNDKYNIARLYTDGRGLLSVLVRQGKTALSRQRNAMFMPLSLLEFVADIKPGRELAHVHDVRRSRVLLSLHGDAVKMTLAMFVSEVLTRAIVEQERNDNLYAFLSRSVLWLNDATRGIANFHICFLYQLGKYVGIQPDIDTYRQGYWFDMEEGVFTRGTPMGHRSLRPHEARALYVVAHMSYDNMHLFRFNREQRGLLLETTLAYYRLHQSTLGTLRSLDVLRQIFSTN